MCFVFSGGESGEIRSPCFVVFITEPMARFVEADRQIKKGRNER